MADRYWVGGTGTWDATTTTNWSATSGGAGGASAPTSADNVFFNLLSNATGYTVTVGTNAACEDFTVTAPLTGAVTMTVGATAVLNCYGSMTLPATNCTWSSTTGAILNFLATTSGKTFTTNGVALGALTINFAGVNGEWTLGSAVSFAGGTINVSSGTLSTSGSNYSITGSTFIISGSLAKTVTLNASTLTVSSAAPFSYSGSNLTFNAGTSQITCSATSPTFAGGGQTFYNVSFTSAASGTATISGTNTFNNLTFTSRSATGLRVIALGNNQTVSGTLTLGAANTAIRRIQIRSSVIGTQRTITLNGSLATLADVDFRDIATAGTVGTWTGTRIGNALGNSGITFDAAKTVYWNLAGTQNWSATGWATTNNGAPAVNNFPLPQDTATFTEAGAAGTVTVDFGWWFKDLQMADGVSNRTTAFTLATGGQSLGIYGNVTLFSSLTLTGTGTLFFAGQGTTQTITSAGISFTQPFTIESPSGTFQLLDNNTVSNTVTLTAGTLDLSSGNRTLTCRIFSSNNSNARSIAFGTGQIDLTGNNGSILNLTGSSNLTLTGTPNIYATYSGSTGTRSISGGTQSSGTDATNSISLYVTGGSDAIDLRYRFLNIDFTGFTGTLTNQSSVGIFEDLTFSSGMTINPATSDANQTIFLATSGTQLLTTNGITVESRMLINGVGGTTRLEDNLTMGSTRTLEIANGTLNANDKNVTCGSFNSNNANTRVLTMGSGTWTIQDAEWNITDSTGMTLNRGTSTITMTSTSAKAFAGGGLTYYILNQGGIGDLTLSGANTFYDMTNTVQPCTIAFPASTNTSFTNFNLNGTLGNLVSLRSSSPGTRYTLVKL